MHLYCAVYIILYEGAAGFICYWKSLKVVDVRLVMVMGHKLNMLSNAKHFCQDYPENYKDSLQITIEIFFCNFQLQYISFSALVVLTFYLTLGLHNSDYQNRTTLV